MSFSTLCHVEESVSRDMRKRRFVNSNWDSASRTSLFPQVRYWQREISNWSENVVYVQRNDTYNTWVEITGYWQVARCYAYHRETGMEASFNLNIPASKCPWEWVTLKKLTMIKRLLHARLDRRKEYAPSVYTRFVDNGSWLRSNNLSNTRERHRQLLDRVKMMHERTDNKEQKLGWLRVYRHIRRDPSLIGYSSDEVEAMEGKVSYGRYAFNPVKKRVRCRMSKCISAAGVNAALTGLMYQDWLSTHVNSCKMKIVEGSALERAYVDSIGCHSCMTGCPELVALYTENPEKVKMLILMEHDVPIGRALLWHLPDSCVAEDEKPLYIDRPYPQSDRVFARYRHYAKEHGIKYSYMDNGLPLDAWCHIRPPECKSVPYMDSWGGLNVLEDCWELVRNNGRYSVCSTEGGPFYCCDRIYCCYCDEPINREDAYDPDGCDDFYCEMCYNERFPECDCCGENTYVEELIDFENGCWCEHCIENETFICEECGLRLRNTESSDAANNCNMDLCKDCWNSMYVKCFGCEDAVLIDDADEWKDGQLYCSHCFEELEEEGGV